MSEDNAIHTRDELDKMKRLQLRRIAKARGMTAEDCAKESSDALIEFILEKQDEASGGGAKKGRGKAKASPKAEPEEKEETGTKPSAKDRLAARRGKAGKAKASPKARAADDAGDDGSDDAAPVDSSILTEILERLDALSEKIDTIGQVVDQNFSGLIENVNEVGSIAHVTRGLVRHMGDWLESEEILTADHAPEDLGFQEKHEELDNECEGNDEDDPSE